MPVGHATYPSSAANWSEDNNYDKWENSFLISFWVNLDKESVEALSDRDEDIGCITLYGLSKEYGSRQDRYIIPSNMFDINKLILDIKIYLLYLFEKKIILLYKHSSHLYSYKILY